MGAQNQAIIDMEKLLSGTYLIHSIQDVEDSVKKVVKIK